MRMQKHLSSFGTCCPLALSSGLQDQSPYVSLRKWFGREAVEMLAIVEEGVVAGENGGERGEVGLDERTF